jgi:hypothetical protein
VLRAEEAYGVSSCDEKSLDFAILRLTLEMAAHEYGS